MRVLAWDAFRRAALTKALYRCMLSPILIISRFLALCFSYGGYSTPVCHLHFAVVLLPSSFHRTTLKESALYTFNSILDRTWKRLCVGALFGLWMYLARHVHRDP